MDVFYIDGALDWNAVSTVSTVVLTAALVIVTAWYAYLIHKKDNYDRLVKEMEQLISPLYAKSRSQIKMNYFNYHAPGYTLSDENYRVATYNRFWDEIQHSKYLGPENLRNAINSYLDSRSQDPFTNRTVSHEYNLAEEHLINCIERRYIEISYQLSRKTLREEIVGFLRHRNKQ